MNVLFRQVYRLLEDTTIDTIEYNPEHVLCSISPFSARMRLGASMKMLEKIPSRKPREDDCEAFLRSYRFSDRFDSSNMSVLRLCRFSDLCKNTKNRMFLLLCFFDYFDSSTGADTSTLSIVRLLLNFETVFNRSGVLEIPWKAFLLFEKITRAD
uniref:Uncharacterized protein n=1 Tax=Romanomermis culicivorax TaxID=13658 RepID=A0A915IYN4_ROMCU